ncbi:AAA family ATPase [Paenibacillus sp. FSL P2-0136]
MLYIFGGLPGTGKSTLASALASELRAPYLWVDVVSNVAESLGIPFVEIEVVCSDECTHKHRITTRTTDIPGFTLPTWSEVKNRHYDAWDRDHIVIDTAHQTVTESWMSLREQLSLKKLAT